jgi:hypothetical protein
VALALLAGCTVPTGASPPSPPAALAALLADATAFGPLAAGTDRWEVWVCAVPPDTAAAPFDAGAPRLALTPEGLVDALDGPLGEYFEQLSHGRYRLALTPGGVVALGGYDGPEQCADAALDRSSPSARGVLAVADAPHRTDADGGFGTPGEPCPHAGCPAATTRRVVYVGGADFHPDWGTVPALDLLEHELGHALAWPHSAVDQHGATGRSYTSAIDVMSDSASPRAVDPDRRHGPSTLAVNLLASGWIPTADAVTVPDGGREVQLAARTAGEGPRVAVVGLDEHRLLTIELVAATGFDDHLPAGGVAVHLVNIGGPACGRPTDERCGPLERTQQPLVGDAPYADLLQPGESWTGEGWHVRVLDAGPRWRVAVRPAS